MHHSIGTTRRRFLRALAATAAAASSSRLAWAAEPLKIGLILPLTGPFASTGRQVEAACRLYIARNGDTVAGRKVELIVKDDAAAPETTKRIAQELIVQDKVNVLAGFGLTPLALATAPVATSESTDDRDGRGDLGHSDALAVHRALELRVAAGYCANRRVVAQEQPQASGDAGGRLRAWA